MHLLTEEHDESLNFSKENGTRETNEELDMLSQTREETNLMLWKLVRSYTSIWNKLRNCNIVTMKKGKY